MARPWQCAVIETGRRIGMKLSFSYRKNWISLSLFFHPDLPIESSWFSVIPFFQILRNWQWNKSSLVIQAEICLEGPQSQNRRWRLLGSLSSHLTQYLINCTLRKAILVRAITNSWKFSVISCCSSSNCTADEVMTHLLLEHAFARKVWNEMQWSLLRLHSTGCCSPRMLLCVREASTAAGRLSTQWKMPFDLPESASERRCLQAHVADWEPRNRTMCWRAHWSLVQPLHTRSGERPQFTVILP